MFLLLTVQVHVPPQLGEEQELTGLKISEIRVGRSDSPGSCEERRGDIPPGRCWFTREELSVICQSELKQIETKAKQLPE